MRYVLAAALVIVSSLPAQGQTCNLSTASGVSSQQLTSGQRARVYRLFVPPGYDGRARLPLVLDLHGSGGTAAGQARNSGFETLAATEGFLVATLEGEGNRWNVPAQSGRADDVAYVSDVITHVAARVCTDESRVYMTGFSGGATHDVARRLPARLATCGGRSGIGPALARPLRRAPRAGADLSRAGRSAESVRRTRRGPGTAEWLESVPEALAGWARHNGCRGDAILDDPPGPLSTMRYDGCGDAEVRMIRIDGLGHTWTKTEVDTTGVMWQFFKSHQRSR